MSSKVLVTCDRCGIVWDAALEPRITFFTVRTPEGLPIDLCRLCDEELRLFLANHDD